MDKRNIKLAGLYKSFTDKIYVFLRSLTLPLAIIEKELPREGKIADVGCGLGLTGIYLSENKGLDILGLDIDEKRISLANQAAADIKNIEFRANDLLENNNGKFDGIIMIDLLHHLNRTQKKRLIRQTYDALNNGGVVLIKDINLLPKWKFFLNWFHDKIVYRSSPAHYFNLREISGLMTENGFVFQKIIPVKTMFYPHIIYEFQKI